MKKYIHHTWLVILAASFCLFVFNSAVSAGQAEIKFPFNKVIVTSNQIRIIGLAPGNKTVTLTVASKGKTHTEELNVDRDAFTAQVNLHPGENTISVGDSDKRSIYYNTGNGSPPAGYQPYFLHSKGDLVAKCDDCHLVVLREKPNYTHIEQNISCITAVCHADKGTKKFQHGPLEEGFCDGCHRPHGSLQPNFLKKKNAELCYTCHTTEKETFQEGVVHFPVSKGECLSCHDPHQSDFEFHLKRENVRELCAACHGYERLRHKYMHEPVEAEDCVACHSPHNSPYKNLLFEEGNEMCFTCHEVRKEEFNSKFIHEPVKKDCTLCHDPHGSETEFHLRTAIDDKGHYIVPEKPIEAACLLCHKKLNPEIVEQMGKKFTHKPVAEGKCTACHTPHSTNYPKQLNAPLSEICYGCHEEMKEFIAGSTYKHGPVRTDDCAQCHLVHGSDYKFLLRDRFLTKFYADFKEDNFKLCFNCHNSKVVNDKKTRDTGFRNGRKNLHYVHVHRKKKGRSCITCHEVHASDQKNHIRSKIPYRRRHSISLEYTATETGGGCVVGCHKPRKYDREKPVRNRKK